MKITELKKTLGYFGFVPFISLAIIPWIFGEEIAECSIFILCAYSAIVLSFLGGISWGWDDKNYSQDLNIIYGITFSLFGCLILLSAFFEPVISLSIAFIGFNAFYYFESRRDMLFDHKIKYKQLRKNLTVLVSICFLITIAYIVNPYS